MLWVNLIMDSLASLALATEPPNAVLLDIPPFSKGGPLAPARLPPMCSCGCGSPCKQPASNLQLCLAVPCPTPARPGPARFTPRPARPDTLCTLRTLCRAPAEHEFVDPSTPPVKHIVGQALYQLVVMYLLVFHGPALLGVPDHSMVSGPSEHYTIVFNAFVLMQVGAGRRYWGAWAHV